MSISCIIIEDDLIDREILHEMVKKISMIHLVAVCSSALEANTYLASGNIDLIISDIEMSDLSGLDLIKALKNPPMVIFVTSHPEYAIAGFELEAIDYLVKPLNFERLIQAINKADRRMNTQSAEKLNQQPPTKEDHFFIRTDAQYVKLKYDEVIYVEAYGDFVKIYTADTHLIALVNLKNIEEQLPKSLFIRVHRSYIINMTKIDTMDNAKIRSLHYCIPISQAYKEKVYSKVVDKRLVKRFGGDVG